MWLNEKKIFHHARKQPTGILLAKPNKLGGKRVRTQRLARTWQEARNKAMIVVYEAVYYARRRICTRRQKQAVESFVHVCGVVYA